MDSLKALLENHFIYKDANRELYYSIYDSHDKFKPFLAKLGYQFIIRNDFIRLEKFPADVDGHMGFEGFTTIEEYMFFMLLLIFLEDKSKDEQFLLADAVEFMEGNGTLEIDTTVQRTRRQICRVLNFAKENHMIVLCGGNIDGYIADVNTQVLYDNTGLSKYFMRNFSTGLNRCENYDDLLNFVQSANDKDSTAIRRNTVYRNLLLRPAVYNRQTLYDEYGYIKNYRSTIAEDFDKYLGWPLHIQRELAMVVPNEDDKIKDVFPSKDGLSATVLLFNLEVRKRVDENRLEINKSGNINLSKNKFVELASYIKETKGNGFTQTLRKMTPEKFADELLTHLARYMMCEVVGEEVVLLPAFAKIVGDYPKSFYAKPEGENE